jgi:alkaline phosphatase D
MSPPVTAHDRLVAGLSRRELLRLAASIGGAALAQPLSSRRLQAQTRFAEYPFALGVASGDPLPDGVVLWTRLAPRPLEGGGMPPSPVDVAWEVARDRRFRTIVQKGTATAQPELAHSVHVEVSGLEPARDYFYRFRAGREISQVGRARTAPPAGAAVDRLRFAVCGCSYWEDGYFTAYRRIAEGDFDFVLHTGDYIYEARPSSARLNRKIREHVGDDEVSTLAQYRTRYAQYKTDADLRAAHRSAPFVMSWDDHEVANNYAGDLDMADTPREVFLLRRAAAYQAYYEHMPLRRAAFPNHSRMKIYRRLQFGSLMDLNILDTRQYRSNQACGDGARTGCAEALDPRRTMLGDDQERWLYDNLATARARWTLIGQQVLSFARDLVKSAPEGRYAMDKWDGYVAARNRLYSRLKDAKTPNPIVISGDVHAHFAAELKMDFTDVRSESIGVEFTNSSISAGADGSDVAADWEATRADNPHIKYHANRRGYIACTVTPRQMRAEFRSLERVTQAGAPVIASPAFVVEAGVSRLSPA